MPLYEFSCPEHGDFSSIRNEYTDSLSCPSCGKMARKKVSSFSFRFESPLTILDHKGNRLARFSKSGHSPPPGEAYPVGG